MQSLSPPAGTAGKPFLTIRPTKGWATLEFAELMRFRDLLWTLAGRDVKLRYRQTALGAAWVLLQPLVAAGILGFVFGIVAGFGAGDRLYFVKVYAGQLGWQLFSNTLGRSSISMLGNSQLVSKVYFPRLILPFSSVLSVLIDFAVALGLMAVLLVAFGVNPGWPVVLLPVWVGLMLMLSLGVGLLAAALTVSYRDVQHILPVVTQFLMFASPVAYDVARVPERYQTLYHVNPLVSLIEAFRWSLLGAGDLNPAYLGYSAVVSVAVFATGTLSFKRMERSFADVI